MIWSSKLEKAVKDECRKGNLANRIQYNSENRNGVDYAIKPKTIKLPITEEWLLKTPKMEEEFRNNREFANYGDNIYIFSLVAYDHTFPNQRIALPEKQMYLDYKITLPKTCWRAIDEQHQLILDKNAIVLRQFKGGSYNIDDYTVNDISFGSMLGTSDFVKNERLLKLFFHDFAKNPSEYLHNHQSSGYSIDGPQYNNYFRMVILYSREESTLEKIIRPVLKACDYTLEQ